MRDGSPKEALAAHKAPTGTQRTGRRRGRQRPQSQARGDGGAVGTRGHRQDVECPASMTQKRSPQVTPPVPLIMAPAKNRASADAATRSRSSSSAHAR